MKRNKIEDVESVQAQTDAPTPEADEESIIELLLEFTGVSKEEHDALGEQVGKLHKRDDLDGYETLVEISKIEVEPGQEKLLAFLLGRYLQFIVNLNQEMRAEKAKQMDQVIAELMRRGRQG